MAKEAIRIGSTFLNFLSFVVLVITINTQRWVQSESNMSQVIISFNYYRNIFWSCESDANGHHTCREAPYSKAIAASSFGNIGNAGYMGEGLLTLIQIFAVTAVCTSFLGFLFALASTDVMKFSNSSSGKNRNNVLSAGASFITTSFMLVALIVFIVNQNQDVVNVQQKMNAAYGFYLGILGCLLALVGGITSLSGREEREDNYSDYGQGSRYHSGQPMSNYDEGPKNSNTYI